MRNSTQEFFGGRYGVIRHSLACHLLIVMLTIWLFPAYAHADSIPVAIFSNNDKVMTFAYGKYKVDNKRIFTMPIVESDRISLTWYSKSNSVEKVIFSPSFAKARLRNTSSWFYRFTNLKSIYGIKNLNTSDVTDMSNMFGYCSALKSIDLSNFNTSKVTNMSNMFSGCDSLDTVFIKDTHFVDNAFNFTSPKYLYYCGDYPSDISMERYSYRWQGGHFDSIWDYSGWNEFSLSLPYDSVYIPNGQSFDPILTITPACDTIGIKATSSDPTVATVDAAGIVHAVGLGEADIKYVADRYKRISVTLHVSVISVTLGTNTFTRQKNDSFDQQRVTILPKDSKAQISIVSEDESVASVDESGKITCREPGVTNVYYQTNCGLNAATCHVTIYDEGVVYNGGYYYLLNSPRDGEAAITSIYGGSRIDVSDDDVPQIYSGTINIPTSITYLDKNYKITSVGKSAFYRQDSIQAINIPYTVTTIGSNASAKSKGVVLVNVEDGSQLVNVGENAFMKCPRLRRVTFSGTTMKLKSIDENAFYGCTDLQQVTWNGNTSLNIIDDCAFDSCTSLRRVTWKGNCPLRTIDDYAFYSCSSLNHFVMPDSVTRVGKHSFRYNGSLADIHLAKSLSFIDEYAFGECGFSNITLPDTLANLQAGAFINNAHLTSITIPARVTGIGAACFENNAVLDTVTFQTDIRTMTIGSNAFNKCPNLKRVNIQSLDSWAETNFNNAKANPANTSHHLYMDGQEVINAVLNEGTKTINNNAFNGCSSLASIDVPSTVQNVCDDIFTGCTSLTAVYCRATDVPIFTGQGDPSTMDDVFYRATLYVVPGYEEDYKEDSWWGRFYRIKPIKAPAETGDSNGDGKIDVSDAVAINSYLLLLPIEDFDVAAADVNKDGHISVSDISATIDMILAQTPSGTTPSSAKAAFGMNSLSSSLLYQQTTSKTLSIALEDGGKYNAVQMDVMLPETVGNATVSLCNGNDKSRTLAYNRIGNRLRIVIYSMDNKEFVDGEAFVNIQLQKQGDYKSIVITNAIASDNDAVSHKLDVKYSNVGTTTGIETLGNHDVSVRSVNGGLEIYGSNGKNVVITTLAGSIYKKATIKSNAASIELPSGIYLVSVINKTYKIVVK